MGLIELHKLILHTFNMFIFEKNTKISKAGQSTKILKGCLLKLVTYWLKLFTFIYAFPYSVEKFY